MCAIQLVHKYVFPCSGLKMAQFYIPSTVLINSYNYLHTQTITLQNIRSETMSTLKYAYRAKSIANAVTRNEDSNERMIRDLQSQIEELKRKLQSGEGGMSMRE